jgi:CRISPR type III-A-associated RAMP protein Csm5
MSPAEHLLEEVVWRLEVLTPLHAGSGEQLTKGLDVESVRDERTREIWTYAVDMDRLFEALSPGQRDRVGREDLGTLCPGLLLREVQRYAMRGEIGGFVFGPNRKGEQLRCFARDGFGRPYLPGSTLKGALRTVLLGAIAEKDGYVQQALRDAARRRGKDRNGKGVDEQVQKAAFRIGEEREVDDVLRHLHVPDVHIPPDAVEVVLVKIKSMGEGSDWNTKTWSTFLEAVRPETVLRVPLRIDARALQKNDRQDFSPWERLLQEGLLDAVHTHGQRLLPPEVALWTGSRPIAAAGRAVTRLAARSKKSGEALFPVAWGIGWRGMTGATLEWLDGPSARTADANADDPALLRAARQNHPMMEGRPVPVFPKSRRLAFDGGEPALPLGWVAVRAWKEGDVATAFQEVKAPEGRLPGQAPRRQEAGPPRRSAPAPVAAAAKPGDPVRGTLTGKSPKGKWKVTLLRPVVTGTVVEGEAPEGLEVGMEVDLKVKTAALGGQDWQLGWPPKKG